MAGIIKEEVDVEMGDDDDDARADEEIAEPANTRGMSSTCASWLRDN